jgi:hypothetical protein
MRTPTKAESQNLGDFNNFRLEVIVKIITRIP